jgi:hypothetical protein
MAAGFAPEQVAQLKRATDSLATLAQQVHSLPRRQTDARADLGSALLSAETEQSLRETEQIMATLRPHLERTERRLLSKIKQVGDRREQEAEGGVTVSHGGGGGGHAATTIAGRPDDQVGDVTIDPSDPTWVPRTVFVGDIELASATAKLVKEACGRVKDGQERGRGTQNARALLSGASTKGDLIVSVSVRRKPDRQKGSWALVSFSTEAGAKKLLEEQEREVRHRTTGKAWSFHPYEPTRLQSHEAQARKFQSAKHAEQWKKTGLVGHVIASMKDTHKAAAHERTVWVGNIPDRLASEGFDKHMQDIFGRFGRVQKIQTRYKAAAAAGTSWCTVTFANASTAQKVLGERVSVIADGQPADGKRTVNLVLKLADTAAMDRSPVGIARAEVQIKVIQGALVRYRGYLPSSHPTLVRLHAAMARLQRQSKSRPFTARSSHRLLCIGMLHHHASLPRSLIREGTVNSCDIIAPRTHKYFACALSFMRSRRRGRCRLFRDGSETSRAVICAGAPEGRRLGSLCRGCDFHTHNVCRGCRDGEITGDATRFSEAAAAGRDRDQDRRGR